MKHHTRCEAAKTELELVFDVANSFIEIVEENKLKDDLKERKILAVNYIWKIPHWPIIESINNDSAWPNNIFKTLSDEYPDDDERYLKYIEILRSKILEQNVYYPFIKAMQKIGCLADVQEYYADPIFMGGKFVIKKEDLIEWGVYTTEQAKKEIYPYFKSSITFLIDCQSIPASE
ncbi:MAG: hypothetical protein P8179_24200 [Candidatus Thiodiazotropha sp.]